MTTGGGRGAIMGPSPGLFVEEGCGSHDGSPCSQLAWVKRRMNAAVATWQIQIPTQRFLLYSLGLPRRSARSHW
jgi:hypothetical protein